MFGVSEGASLDELKRGYLKTIADLENDKEKRNFTDLAYMTLVAEIQQEYDKIKDYAKKLNAQKNYSEAEKQYYKLYEMNAEDYDTISALTDIIYMYHNDIKKCIGILDDCVKRTDEKRLKVAYFAKAYVLACKADNDNYNRVKSVLLKKMSEYVDEDEQIRYQISERILTQMFVCLGDGDIKAYEGLENIYRMYDSADEELAEAYSNMREVKNALDTGKVHPMIRMLAEADKRTLSEDDMYRMGQMLIDDIDNIKASLEYIRDSLPWYWNYKKKGYDNTLKFVEYEYTMIKEYQNLEKDEKMEKALKQLVRVMIGSEMIKTKGQEVVFEQSRNEFFAENNVERSLEELERLYEKYPRCYKIISDFFFDGKNIEELFKKLGVTKVTIDDDVKENKTEENKAKENKAMQDKQKKSDEVNNNYSVPPKATTGGIKRTVNRLEKIVIAIILIVVVIKVKMIFDDSSEEKYDKAHDNWLTTKELQKADSLTEKYKKKTDITIKYIQKKSGDDMNVPYEGAYIYLSYKDNGYSFPSGTYNIHTNCLTDDEVEELSEQISDAIYNDKLTDYEKCEGFYEATYNYVENNNITYDNYIAMEEYNNQLQHYEINYDGDYYIGYDSEIEPGIYTLSADTMSGTTVYVCIYRESTGYANRQIYRQFEISGYGEQVTLKEGDIISVNYRGKGAYSLYLDEK